MLVLIVLLRSATDPADRLFRDQVVKCREGTWQLCGTCRAELILTMAMAADCEKARHCMWWVKPRLVLQTQSRHCVEQV